MSDRHDPVLRPPIAFAHGGARAHERENTLAAFELALRLGATGLEADVWLTADGVPVLDRDGVIGRRPRRRRIADLPRSELPDHILTLDELYGRLGGDFDLSLVVSDDAAMNAVVAVGRAHEDRSGRPVVSRLWLCHHDVDVLTRWRQQHEEVRLVDRTRLHALAAGPERRAAELAAAGIDAVSMPFADWTGGLLVLFRRFEVLSFAGDAHHDRMLDDLLRMGVDAVYSDHVDRMVDALGRAGWSSTGS